jgi:DNA-binding response OmpR family regulator
MARVRSRLRERTGAITMVLSRGDVTLDLLARRCTVAGHDVDLSAREFALPSSSCGTPVRFSRVRRRQPHLGPRLRSGLERRGRLRAVPAGKLGADHIATVRGEGYRWE